MFGPIWGEWHMKTGSNKAIAAGASGAASVLIIWLVSLWGVTVPAEVASAATTLAATVFTWLVPSGRA
jgi:hypothetical protein